MEKKKEELESTAAIAGGADIIRAHDVFSAVQGARVADAIYRRCKPNG